MLAWTKADFDSAYSIRVERQFGGHPSRAGRPEMRLHYHEWAIKPIMVNRWRRLLRVLTPAIDAADRVLIVGAGFGWGVRALRRRIGCSAIGTDTSPFIQTEKDNDDSIEVSAAVTAAGLDPTTGRGLELLKLVKTSGARVKELVLDEDLSTVESRQNVRAALRGGPTWIITEDLVTDAITDAEITTMAGHFDKSTARKIWLYTPTQARTSEQLAALTGHKVIEFGTYRIVG
ncbi:MAG: hypothetical protein FVQ79_00005 [Planctomycetes bacterium]|nr:hypothetical protein [Planctomycetota bacterium]